MRSVLYDESVRVPCSCHVIRTCLKLFRGGLISLRFRLLAQHYSRYHTESRDESLGKKEEKTGKNTHLNLNSSSKIVWSQGNC